MKQWNVRLRWMWIRISMSMALAAGSMQGTELLRDNFEYADGPLIGAAGSPWQAHSQGGNGPVLVSGGRIELRADQAEDVNAPLADGGAEPGDGTAALYARFTVHFTELPSSSGTYFAHFRSGSSWRARVWASTANAAPGMYRLGIGNSTGADAASGQVAADLSPGTDYEVVVRYEMDTGLSSIGVDPETESDLVVTAADTPGVTGINSFSFRQATGMGVVRIGTLRVEDTFPAVGPSGVRLGYARLGDELSLSWPAGATNYVLQRTPSLDAPVWVDVEETPEGAGEDWVMRVMSGSGAGYYRLRAR